MKKILTFVILCIFLFSALGCEKSDFNYGLNVMFEVSESDEKTLLSLYFYIDRSLNGFSDDDSGDYFYYGKSIYRYKIFHNDKEIYSYNYDDDTLNKSTEDSPYVNGAYWEEVYPYRNDIVIDEIGTYKLEVEYFFIYEYTGKTHNKKITKEIEVRRAKKDYRMGQIYELDEAYENGFITYGDLKSIAYYHNGSNVSNEDIISAEFKPTLIIDNLNEETKKNIILTITNDPNNNKYSVLSYYGTYNGVSVVKVKGPSGNKDTIFIDGMFYTTIDNLNFSYIKNETIFVYIEDK